MLGRQRTIIYVVLLVTSILFVPSKLRIRIGLDSSYRTKEHKETSHLLGLSSHLKFIESYLAN